MRTMFALASLLALAACDGEGALGPDFDDRLVTRGGCGDLVFYAVDGADELMLSFLAEGLVSEADAAGEETTTVFTLPHVAVELILEQGTRVSDAMCDDVIEEGGPEVHRAWRAASGTATVVVRPDAEAFQDAARADLLLEDVVFESGGATVALDRMEWLDVFVGWYPG